MINSMDKKRLKKFIMASPINSEEDLNDSENLKPNDLSKRTNLEERRRAPRPVWRSQPQGQRS